MPALLTSTTAAARPPRSGPDRLQRRAIRARRPSKARAGRRRLLERAERGRRRWRRQVQRRHRRAGIEQSLAPDRAQPAERAGDDGARGRPSGQRHSASPWRQDLEGDVVVRLERAGAACAPPPDRAGTAAARRRATSWPCRPRSSTCPPARARRGHKLLAHLDERALSREGSGHLDRRCRAPPASGGDRAPASACRSAPARRRGRCPSRCDSA